MKPFRHDYRDDPIEVDEHRGPVPIAWLVTLMISVLIWLALGRWTGCIRWPLD